MMSRISWFKLMILIYGWNPWARVQWFGTLFPYRRHSKRGNSFESLSRVGWYVHHRVKGSGKGSPGVLPDSLMCTWLRCSAYQWLVIFRYGIIINRFVIFCSIEQWVEWHFWSMIEMKIHFCSQEGPVCFNAFLTILVCCTLKSVHLRMWCRISWQMSRSQSKT